MRHRHAHGGTGLLAMIACAAWLAIAGSASAETAEFPARTTAAPAERMQLLRKGNSSRAARTAAVGTLPLDRLTPAHRERAEEIIRSAGLFRELPSIALPVDPEVYRFFTAHPDVAVSIWRVMGISKFQMWQTGPDEYEADAGDGTCGVIEVLLRGDDHCLILCEGLFASPLLTRPVRASALIHLQTAFVTEADGATWARHRAAMYVAFPSQTVETVARLASPVGNIVLDSNFREISLFLQMMSLAMERQPGWIERTARRLDGVLESRRTELLKLSARVYIAARKRQLRDEDGLTLDEILAPLYPADATAGAERPRE